MMLIDVAPKVRHAVCCLVLGWLCATIAQPAAATDMAVEGYDVVAYFTHGRATAGSAEHSVEWHGREWHFASGEHARMFRDDPERYAPAYDSHCAWAMSQGRLSQGRPQFWAIHGGRLFMNCNARVHEQWLANRTTLIERADREWDRLQGH